ncbi:MAG: acyltransferase domain-containing protein, partial [Candidatus Rokubacteria bacterium]|nr:acyltransferase domain-containing protein [Candidatus Rokubacteria bacterium]
MSSEVVRPFEVIALTPPAEADPSIAIAASRAGGLGVLDLEYVQDERIARAAIAKLSRYAKGACGIKLDGQDSEFVAALASELPEQVKVVILTPGDPDDVRQEVQALRRRNRTVVLETTCLAHALLGEEMGVDGLIAKGHEAGGRVGEETTFILFQQLLPRVRLPVWAQGGIGLHTAGACYVAGAAGVVLDAQLLLTRESSLPEMVRAYIGRMDGSETICLGTELGDSYRAYFRPGFPAIDELRHMARALADDSRPRPEILAVWRQAIRERAGWGGPERHLWLVGQDVAFAAALAERFQTVGGVLEGVRQAIDAHVRAARALRPLDEGASLARSHGTRYPIVQGPMTRVSDRAEFALRVAEGGGLPLLALALMRAPEVETLLEETRRLLEDRPWGVGILGFVPLELRQEQLEVIRAYRPPFALIAGGRPDQARSLEKDGIPTYLHVPSPGLLRMFLQDGARRFVFEGRECGGHVGPRSSFVLWNTMIDVLLDAVPPGDAEACHVLFAGGIHDALSASMVAVTAAPLAERGMRVGVLMGTAYLFTQEAVATGAILPGFQKEALRCRRTVLLETGPGHAIRCSESPYAAEFEQEKRRLLRETKSPEEIRLALEDLNIGRLRIASKGIDRDPRYGQDPAAAKFVTLSEEEQHAQGMYMVGQLVALHGRTCGILELHHEIAVEGARRLEEIPIAAEPVSKSAPAAQPSEIAIVGMSCILPKASDLPTYWANILNKVNAITEIPEGRWDWKLYYDPDPRARDKIYSKWGGFLDDVAFDPVEYGMPPTSLPSIDPMQLLALKAARAALQDAGYLDRPFDRSRTSVILGASGGTGDLGTAYLLRSSLPLLFGDAASDVVSKSNGILPEWTEDSFPGLLLNVAAGRITNRFDFGGLNYVVDAACASSLTAVHLAVKELETHATDMVISGGVDTVQNPFGYLCFSKTQALSPTGQPRTFDASADGITIGEGVVMLVLKRLADAERDGDRIYAVIQGVGGSSDGKAKGLTAPRPEGQILALRRAYAKAGVSATTVALFEAHGTGTVVGDRTEAVALSAFLEEAGAVPQSCAIGSVKSMIGHTKATAGVAGLVKVALALYHKVLPPTLGVTQPNPKARFGDGPLYVNTETRPWVHGVPTHPRRAGVSAFGFGGTNFHAVVEEYTGSFLPPEASPRPWPSELLLWSARSRQELLDAIESLRGSLRRGARPALHDLAYSLWEISDERGGGGGGPDLRLAIVATSLEDLQQKLDQASVALGAAGPLDIQDPRGIYLTEEPLTRDGRVAFLFPGQGSQYPNMLRDLAVQFSEVREAFERADRVLAQRFARPLSSYIFPPPAFSPEEEHAQQEALTQTTVAQPALGAADVALFRLLQGLGVAPHWVAGHSYGEYVALCAAGVFDEETLAVLSEARGRSIIEAAKEDLGTMAAVHAGPERLTEVVGSLDGVWIANVNAPQQAVISGTRSGVGEAIKRLKAEGIEARLVPVACAFHSPLIASARDRLAKVLSSVEFRAPQRQVFSNASAAPYPEDP